MFNGGMNNMQGMMKKVQKMQAEMVKLQEELKTRTLETTAGGGAVTLVVNGKKELESIKIDPAAVDPDDVEMLEDLILTCVNEALRKVDSAQNQEFGKFNIPGIM